MRRGIAVAMAVLVVGLALFLLTTKKGPISLLISQEGPINQVTYDRIELGMTEEKVADLVGVPPQIPGKGPIKARDGQMVRVAEKGKAHFSNEEVRTQDGPDNSVLFVDEKTGRKVGKAKFWDTERYSLVVLFGPDGRVMGKTLYQFKPE